MQKPQIPLNESDRQLALERYNILDTLPEQEYDDLTQLAASICGTPIALISFIDRDRQWFKSRVGLDTLETPRDISFCGHAVANDAFLNVPDAIQDPRFADNPLVVNEPNIRFYAGVPLRTSDNFNLGTLCVIDSQPHDLTPQQIKQLEALGRLAISLLELRRNNEASKLLVSVLESSHKVSMLQQAILDSVNFAVIATDLQGGIQSFNSGAESLLGYKVAEITGKSLEIFHDINEISENSHQLSIELNQPVEIGIEVFTIKAKLGKAFEKEWTYICKNGDRIPVLLSITAIYNQKQDNQKQEVTGFLCVAKDITAQKESERDRFLRQQTEKLVTTQNQIAGVLAESSGFSNAAMRILRTLCELLSWDIAELWLVSSYPRALSLMTSYSKPEIVSTELIQTHQLMSIEYGSGLIGSVWAEVKAKCVEIDQDPNFYKSEAVKKIGISHSTRNRPDEISEQRVFVVGLVVPARAGGGADAHAVALGQFEVAGDAQVHELPIPDDDVLGRQAGGEQTFYDGGDDGRPRAARAARRGENFQADDVIRLHHAAPCLGQGRLARVREEAALHHAANDVGARRERLHRQRVLHDDDAGLGELRWSGEGGGGGGGPNAE